MHTSKIKSSYPHVKIGGYRIGSQEPTFVIAEIGANHNGDLLLAKELVIAARDAGANCAKFQTYTTELFCHDREKKFSYLSNGRKVVESEFDMFKRLEFMPDEWGELINFCEQENVQFLTTIQDPVNLDMMVDLGLQGIKVGSDDFDHIENLKYYASSGLPMIISKGMSDLDETIKVLENISPLIKSGLVVLHCVSIYPAGPEFLNISQIETLRNKFPEIVWGFSDHSRSVIAPALAVAKGAKIIEKHFTLDHGLEGPDHWFSMDPMEFKVMVDNVRFAETALGNGEIEVTPEEHASRSIMRRRLFASKNLKEGQILDVNCVEFKRGLEGLFALDWIDVQGKPVLVAKKPGDPIRFGDIER